jgi:hypothetical protein
MSVFRHTASRTHSGQDLKPVQKKASTVMTANTFGTYDSAGRLQVATSASTSIQAIIQRTVASTDSDYADTTTVLVDVPREGDEFIIDTSASSGFVAGDERPLSAAGTMKATAATTGEVPVLVVKKALTGSKAVVTVKTGDLKIAASVAA